MYTAHFGLTQPPFSIAPDPRYLFMSERHQEALAHLDYGLSSGGGFVLITGEVGTGKTTVCRHFLSQIPPNAQVAYIFHPKLTATDLLQTICQEFGIVVPHNGPGPASFKDHIDPLNTHLLACHASGKNNLLIIDEAQSLSTEVLEQLRLLTNLETNERKLLQIILIGQPELRHMLTQPALEPLAQRVIARFHLGTLTASETQQYVAHRMGVAGWQGPLPITTQALLHIHTLTGGVPRKINLLCDRALLGAYANATTEIGVTNIQQAAIEVFDEPQKLATPPQTPPLQPSAQQGWANTAWGALTGILLTAAAWSGTTAWRMQTPAPQANTNPTPTAIPIEWPTTGPAPSGAWQANENQAFSTLGSLWGQTLGTQRPCAMALQHGLQCYRVDRITLNGLRQIDRPAVLQLFTQGNSARLALVTGINDQTIEISAGPHRWHMPLGMLTKIWRGHYVTLWRTPPGQVGHLSNGYQRPASQWMAQQLATMQSQGRLPPLSSAPLLPSLSHSQATAQSLKTQVEAFQRNHGLEINGIASPTTLMLINRAAGVPEPRLTLLTPKN